MDEIQPLVSVPVITYNSSKTVVETLDSIYNQTYPKLELIVSDDCSTDNTVEICRSWIESHKDRFIRTKLLTVEKNTGVSANMNRAEASCQGEWVKPIAGDDLLLPGCIEVYVQFAKKHLELVYAFSKVEVFGSNSLIVEKFSNVIFDYSFFDLPIEKQFDWLITKSFQPIPAATSFYNRKKVIELGIDYDERIPMLDDWPRWIRLLEKGVRFYFIDDCLTRYRVSESSICSGMLYSEKFNASIALMYLYYQFEPYKKSSGRIKAYYKYLYCKKIVTGKWYWCFGYKLIWLIAFPKRLLKKRQMKNITDC